jgi:hypothetical protein
MKTLWTNDEEYPESRTMGRKDKALAHVLAGMSPSEIAESMGVTVSTVMAYLYNQVGQGKLQRSDILFSIKREHRLAIESTISEHGLLQPAKMERAVRRKAQQVSRDDLMVYLSLRGDPVGMGDLYDAIRDIELLLHETVRERLKSAYGDNWWRKGVPEKTRVKCTERLERDNERPASDPFCYTTLIELADIIKANWQLLSSCVPKNLRDSVHTFSTSMAKLNAIRNAVMHPVKRIELSEDDYYFVRLFRRDLPRRATGLQFARITLRTATLTSRIQ